MQLKLKEFLYISNLLSISRVIIILPAVYLISIGTPKGNILLVSLALLCAATDVLDGYLSRKLKQVTDLGILLDPIADKIAMAIIFVALIYYRQFPIPLIVFLLYRDLWIFLSGSALLRRTGRPMMANFLGKLNTVIFAAIALIFLMGIKNYFINILIFCGYLTLFLSTISYGISGLKAFTPNYLTRTIIWALVILPAFFLYYFMHNLPYFL